MDSGVDVSATCDCAPKGVASSYIEGVAAPIVDVVLAEHADPGGHTPAAWVAANPAAT